MQARFSTRVVAGALVSAALLAGCSSGPVRRVSEPSALIQQLTVRADALSMHYRERLREWEARGWRIDTDALARIRPHTRVFAIPSPARRELRGWCLDTVPLRPARPTAAEQAASS